MMFNKLANIEKLMGKKHGKEHILLGYYILKM